MDIHNYQGRLELVLKRIKESPISENNKKTIIRFHDNCFSEGLSTARVVRYLYDLIKIENWLGKDFEHAGMEDIKALVCTIEKTSYAEHTKRDLKIILKKFYRWLRGTEEYPPEVRWIKTNIKRNKNKLPEDMLTEDEIEKLINAAEHPRDKALIAVLYESGCRIGELASLKLKNINFDEYGAQLLVNGKTGARRIRIISSVPYLSEWINRHPLKNDPEAPIWINRINENKAIEYAAIKNILLCLKKKAGIKKKVNPHNFRHSRASYLANHLTEAQMNQYFGWVQGSNMPAIYIHISGRDVDPAILRLYGIKNREEKRESKLKPKLCPRCEQTNPFTNKFCSRCGMPLDKETIIEVVEKDMKRKQMDNILDEMLRDQRFREMFMEKIKEVVG